MFKNVGDGRTKSANIAISCPGGELNISGSPLPLPVTQPADTSIVGSFGVNWSSPSSVKPVVKLNVSGPSGFVDTLYLPTQPIGFSNDAELFDSPFNIGSGAEWHRATRRMHSGARSWWCGVESISEYGPNRNDWIETIPAVLGDGAQLSFWAYMAFPTYGSDGLHVLAIGRGDTVEFDYLGSGGALLSFIVGWSQYRYDFEGTAFSPGDSIKIKFLFTSDESDQNEGVFLDDIVLSPGYCEIMTGIGESSAKPDELTLRAYPNPFNSSVEISLNGKFPRESRLDIFDISGRLVRDFGRPDFEKIIWNAQTDGGKDCPSGVYFIRLIAENRITTARVVLIK
jgi:hypothetical protein